MSEFKVGDVVVDMDGYEGVVKDFSNNIVEVKYSNGRCIDWPSQSITRKIKNDQDTHYKKDVEPIDLIEAFDLGFCAGNVIKYVSRAKHKGSEKEDLRKAMYYLKRIIDGLEK